MKPLSSTFQYVQMMFLASPARSQYSILVRVSLNTKGFPLVHVGLNEKKDQDFFCNLGLGMVFLGTLITVLRFSFTRSEPLEVEIG